MAQTFKDLGDVIDKSAPERLKGIIARVVEVVEWHENPENSGSGRYRVGYFEQPRKRKPGRTKWQHLFRRAY